jgi:hypothetical protein
LRRRENRDFLFVGRWRLDRRAGTFDQVTLLLSPIHHRAQIAEVIVLRLRRPAVRAQPGLYVVTGDLRDQHPLPAAHKAAVEIRNCRR